jgi:peptidoglycan/xylan/chitin deacetylase (PgdA/CDA1 family)
LCSLGFFFRLSGDLKKRDGLPDNLVNMQNILESKSQTRVARRKRLIVISIAGLLLLVGLIPVAIVKSSIETKEPPTLVIRIDDIQDFAFREAQLFLLNESVINDVPLSLAVITGMFGEDMEIVQTVKLAVSLGSEVTVHGWKHEDLAKLSFREQVALLFQSKRRIKEIFDFDSRVLVPPMFNYNEDTVAAMREEGYNIISSSADLSEPGSTSKMISLPATVELSDYSNGTWNMKSVDSVSVEISMSVQKHGFAVIVTHPQEFIADGKLNQVNTELYRNLLRTLKENYSFKTLEKLSESRRQR